MSTFPLHFLFIAVYLPVVVAMPEPVSPDGGVPPRYPPPTPPDQPVGPTGRFFFYPGEDNVTGSLEDYCRLIQPQDQMPWFCLCTQCQSSRGPKGDQGDHGLPGSPGSPGRRGLTGFRGPPGFVGRPGVKGQKGDEGDKGDRGAQGFMGPKGSRGFKGDKGEQGLEGRPGDKGPKGDDGVCPHACEPSQGPPGPPGMPGPVGPRGLLGPTGLIGPKGVKGDMGDLGLPGVPGPVGENGEPGPPGDCNCTDGTDGGPGQKGDKGDTGDQGQTGAAGPRGVQGDKGDMGMMGMMGPPGPCMPSIQSAFAAGLTSSYPPPNAPVVFSYVHYNLQGGYDPSTGLYTAPVNGTYVFSYHLSVYQRVLKVGIFHNFVPIIKTTNPEVLGTTSHSVILHLARGDRVWIQVKDLVTNGMYAGSETSSTFSGFLLHPDTCDMALLRAPMPPMTLPEGGHSWGSLPGYATTEPPTSPAGGGSN
ncbi:complement C1q and tumor necrosis factor-related protein 9-like [Pempheris klunzingeri]|uniref:complement C1q and tumor necrosis factor-related protein 9-like n=1 Tax=Pempheris klunzingeri TaxID=3127111 RepID=UPI00397F12B7